MYMYIFMRSLNQSGHSRMHPIGQQPYQSSGGEMCGPAYLMAKDNHFVCDWACLHRDCGL